MRRRINVLLIEDDPGNARLIQEMFKEIPDSPYSLQHADQLSSGLEVLSRGEIDVLLLDLMLPDSMRLDTVRRVVEHSPGLPIVVLTTLRDEQTGIAAMQAGAQDYLFKGEVSGSLISRALRYAMERKGILEALKESENRYRTIFETTGNVTIILERDLTIAMVNREFEKVLGYSKEEVEGKRNWKDLVAKTDAVREAEYHTQNNSRENFLPSQYELRVADKSGFIHEFVTTVSRIPETERSVVSLLDITERNRLQKREKEHIRDNTFLYRSTMDFVKLPTVDAMYKRFGEQVQRRLKNSVVIVSRYNPDHQRFYIQSVSGMKSDSAQVQALGKVFEGGLGSFKVTDQMMRKCREGAIKKTRGGFSKILSNEVPSGLSRIFDTHLKSRGLYVIGFRDSEDLIGCAIVAAGKGNKLEGDTILKTYIQNAATALHKKLAEEELIEARSRLQQLLSSSPAVIYSADIQNDGSFSFSYMSENVKKLLGYEPQEVLYDEKFWNEHIFPEDRKCFLADELPRLYKEGVSNAEYRFKNKAGTYRWIYDEMKLVCDSRGNPREVVGYWVDTTDRKHIEEALMIKHSAMASMLEPTLLTDHMLNIVYVNDAALRLWGYRDMDEIVGKSIQDFIGPKTKFQRITKTVIEEGSWRGELMGTRKDGSSFDARISVSRVKDDMGITCYIASIDDITEQKTAERESKKYRSMLEKMVMKRSTELTMAQKRLQEEIAKRKELEKILKREKKSTA